MKLTVIGGGGVRAMFLAKSIAQKAKALGINKVVFMDNNEKKLGIYGTMAKKVAQRIDPQLDFETTLDAKMAVTDADYVITTIRVGEDKARMLDENAALQNGVIGQETTGAAGFSFAMRSVAALAGYCEMIKKHSKPGVKVFNFTNPAGLVAQALRDLGYDFTYGICDAPSGMLASFAALYGAKPEQMTCRLFGLNHMSFFESVCLDGVDITKRLIEDDMAYVKTDMRYFDKKIQRDNNCIFNEYLYYYLYPEKAFANISAAKEARGKQIYEINKQMTAALSEIDIENDFDTALKTFEKYHSMRENSYMASETGVKKTTPWKFDITTPDDGGYAGVALKFITIAQTNESAEMVLCVPNDGAIAEFENDDIIEVSCTITADGCTPHRFEKLDSFKLELVRRVKAYERMASRAIINKDKTLATKALMLNPLVNSYTTAEKLVNTFVELNKEYSDGWV